MATTVDELITKYTLDPSGYVTGGAVVTHTTKTIDDNVGKAAGGMRSRIESAMSGIISAVQAGLVVVGMFAGAVAAIAGGFIAIGKASVVAAADHEALVTSLTRIVGGAERAKVALTLLHEAAKKPGLGNEEAITGFSQLVNSGLSQRLSFRLVEEFGNQNALASGGKEAFKHIMMLVAKMATTPFLQGDELNQLSEWRIPSYKLVKEKFGTSDPEELKKRGITSQMVLAGLVEAMEKSARAGDSSRNTLDNVADAFHLVEVSMGTAVNQGLMPFLKVFGEVVEEFTNTGVFKAFAENIMNFFNLPTDKTAMEGFLLDALEIATTLAATIRNIVLNLSDLWNLLAPVLGPLPAVARAMAASQGLDPATEGANARRAFEMQLELGRKKAAKQKPFTAEDLPGDSPVNAPSVADQIAQYTRETAQNTRAMREAMRDAIIGGGFFGSKGVTPREAARFINSVVDSRV